MRTTLLRAAHVRSSSNVFHFAVSPLGKTRDDTRMKTSIFRLDSPFRDPLKDRLFNSFKGILERWLLFHELERLYSDARRDADGRSFFQNALAALNVNYEISGSDLARIPRTGPVLVVANHPFGGVEGLILAAALHSVRSDVKVIANSLLGRIPEARDRFILVDPFGKQDSVRANVQPMKRAVALLRNGGMLGVFPAGEVAHWRSDKRSVTDPAWNSSIARLARATGATLVPAYFHGRNGALFQAAGFVHPRLRTALLPYELLNKRNATIEMCVGNPISWSKAKEMETDEAITEHVRRRTYALAARTERRRSATAFLSRRRDASPHRGLEPIAPAGPRGPIVAEIEALPAAATLAESGEFAVHCADSSAIPHVLRELGRLREVTFRAVGEGSGKALDIDAFDAHYRHLFIWNRAENEIVGAYRFGATDEIVCQFGKRGLYTNSLFEYGESFLERIGPALEMGRSFVQEKYQRSHAALPLLWRGVGRYVAQNPRYRILFGPVSITNDYHFASRRLMVDFLQSRSSLPQLSRFVKARTPWRPSAVTPLTGLFGGKSIGVSAHTIEEISAFIADIEPDAKGVPVLLRHYLKLGGKLLGFNLDPNFGDALDGLILVDLAQTDPRTLERHLGKEGAAHFLAYHRADALKVG
jgi:putative hemolysin